MYTTPKAAAKPPPYPSRYEAQPLNNEVSNSLFISAGNSPQVVSSTKNYSTSPVARRETPAFGTSGENCASDGNGASSHVGKGNVVDGFPGDANGFGTKAQVNLCDVFDAVANDNNQQSDDDPEQLPQFAEVDGYAIGGATNGNGAPHSAPTGLTNVPGSGLAARAAAVIGGDAIGTATAASHRAVPANTPGSGAVPRNTIIETAANATGVPPVPVNTPLCTTPASGTSSDSGVQRNITNLGPNHTPSGSGRASSLLGIAEEGGFIADADDVQGPATANVRNAHDMKQGPAYAQNPEFAQNREVNLPVPQLNQVATADAFAGVNNAVNSAVNRGSSGNATVAAPARLGPANALPDVIGMGESGIDNFFPLKEGSDSGSPKTKLTKQQLQQGVQNFMAGMHDIQPFIQPFIQPGQTDPSLVHLHGTIDSSLAVLNWQAAPLQQITPKLEQSRTPSQQSRSLDFQAFVAVQSGAKLDQLTRSATVLRPHVGNSGMPSNQDYGIPSVDNRPNLDENIYSTKIAREHHINSVDMNDRVGLIAGNHNTNLLETRTHLTGVVKDGLGSSPKLTRLDSLVSHHDCTRAPIPKMPRARPHSNVNSPNNRGPSIAGDGSPANKSLRDIANDSPKHGVDAESHPTDVVNETVPFIQPSAPTPIIDAIIDRDQEQAIRINSSQNNRGQLVSSAPIGDQFGPRFKNYLLEEERLHNTEGEERRRAVLSGAKVDECIMDHLDKMEEKAAMLKRGRGYNTVMTNDEISHNERRRGPNYFISNGPDSYTERYADRYARRQMVSKRRFNVHSGSTGASNGAAGSRASGSGDSGSGDSGNGGSSGARIISGPRFHSVSMKNLMEHTNWGREIRDVNLRRAGPIVAAMSFNRGGDNCANSVRGNESARGNQSGNRSARGTAVLHSSSAAGNYHAAVHTAARANRVRSSSARAAPRSSSARARSSSFSSARGARSSSSFGGRQGYSGRQGSSSAWERAKNPFSVIGNRQSSRGNRQSSGGRDHLSATHSVVMASPSVPITGTRPGQRQDTRSLMYSTGTNGHVEGSELTFERAEEGEEAAAVAARTKPAWNSILRADGEEVTRPVHQPTVISSGSQVYAKGSELSNGQDTNLSVILESPELSSTSELKSPMISMQPVIANSPSFREMGGSTDDNVREFFSSISPKRISNTPLTGTSPHFRTPDVDNIIGLSRTNIENPAIYQTPYQIASELQDHFNSSPNSKSSPGKQSTSAIASRPLMAGQTGTQGMFNDRLDIQESLNNAESSDFHSPDAESSDFHSPDVLEDSVLQDSIVSSPVLQQTSNRSYTSYQKLCEIKTEQYRNAYGNEVINDFRKLFLQESRFANIHKGMTSQQISQTLEQSRDSSNMHDHIRTGRRIDNHFHREMDNVGEIKQDAANLPTRIGDTAARVFTVQGYFRTLLGGQA